MSNQVIRPEHVAAHDPNELGALQYYLHGHGVEWTDDEALRVYEWLLDRAGVESVSELGVEEVAIWMIDIVRDTE